MAKVTKDMIIIDVLRMDPDCAQIFFKNGLHCIGCPSASGESIEEASAVHGLDPNKLIKELNDYFEA
ncbi:MAG: DUF1858 domain-containing protein [Clostridia bacterium]|jgi:hybrid cluster-associated redox disulfide protein|nr:DUF1858 domain-containing protein [Clostridia bacterium]MBN2882322.1 DUF1858 domain-containing protein [Clostridia bacterium]